MNGNITVIIIDVIERKKISGKRIDKMDILVIRADNVRKSNRSDTKVEFPRIQ